MLVPRSSRHPRHAETWCLGEKHESVQFFKNKQDGAVWFLQAGRMLQKYFESETLKKGEKNHTWLGHCEGRHHMFSGMHFLLALQAEPAGAVAVATQVEYVLHQAHTGGGLTPRSGGGLTLHSAWVMPEECTERLLTAADGLFPINLRCYSKDSQKQVNHMSSYNAMDFGRWIIAWLCSCRNVEVPLTPKLFETMLEAQASEARAFAVDVVGIKHLDDFIMQKVDVLRHSAPVCY